MCQIILRIFFLLNLFYLCNSNNAIQYNIPDPDCTGVFNLCTDADKERLGRQAIHAIHEQMDDDKDGLIEASESSDFIQEELESKTDSVRHRHFQNADLQITFNDLWTQWQNSAVYNWTNDEVVNWLINYVHLPQYVENFRRNQIDGRMIPRLAANEKHYLSGIMQIRDLRHKRLLIIKATDIVLFGPPQHTHNIIKDAILILAVLISLGACLYAFIRHRRTQECMKTMEKELEALQNAECDLVVVTGKMKAMENELKDKAKVDRITLSSWFLEIQKAKDEAEKFRKRRIATSEPDKQLALAIQEIEQLRVALRQAEEHAQHQSYEPPSELIDLLKCTYLVEETSFDIKRKSAETAMINAKEQMSKITKMQKGFFGAVRIAHTGCMDNISELISAAKERLAEVQNEYEEREKRWHRISLLLERNDLISISSSSTTTSSISNNQYLSGNSSIQTNNGIMNKSLTDPNNRLKQMPIDSNTLINTSIDTSSNSKINSDPSYRSIPPSSTLPMQTSHYDATNQSDTSFESSNSPTTTFKRQIVTNNSFINRISSAERLNINSMIHSSFSVNNFSNSSSSKLNKQNTSDSMDSSSSSSTKPMRSTFDIVNDIQTDNNPIIDSNPLSYDSKSQLSDSLYDDQDSISSSEKARKPVISTKLLKSFQNIRFRKKVNSK